RLPGRHRAQDRPHLVGRLLADRDSDARRFLAGGGRARPADAEGVVRRCGPPARRGLPAQPGPARGHGGGPGAGARRRRRARGEPSITAVARDDLRLVVPVNDVLVETRLPRRIPAPVARRQRVGKVIVRRGTERFGSVTLVSDAEVASTGWVARLASWVRSDRA